MTDTTTGVEAHPIEDWVWCENCGTPHGADFATHTLVDGDPDGTPCEAIEPVQVNVTLPKDWEREFHATYTYDAGSGGGYDLWLKSPPLLDIHHPMYWVDKTTL